MRTFLLLMLVACESPATEGDTSPSVDIIDTNQEDTADSSAVTYHADILPLMERSCIDCHGANRTSLELMEYSVAASLADQIASAVESERMPPWPPDDDCRSVHNPGALTADERALFRTWADTGALEGTPAEEEAETDTSRDEVDADLVLTMAEPYLPDETVVDDYRCFVVDPGLEEDAWVTAMDVALDNSAIVHHVVVWTDPDHNSATLDEEAEGQGYPCYGGPGFDNTTVVGGWAPGGGTMQIPDGLGIQLPAGDPLILQLHYYTANDPGGIDQTSVHVELADDSVAPMYLVPVTVYSLDIPAGESSVVQTSTVGFDIGFDLKVYGGIPHMHKLGTSIEMTRTSSDGEEECLMRIPDWDFDLQGFYNLVEHATIHNGDEITLTCTYDNSADNPNQPSDPPQDVQWGDGTDDEMCLVFAMVGL